MKKTVIPFRTRSTKGQGGFIAGPLLVGIGLIVAIVAFMAMANRGPATSTTAQQNKMLSGAILKEAADISEGYSRLVGDGVLPSNVTFDTGASGLFNTAKGYAASQTVPAKACNVTGACSWAFNKETMTVTGVGASTAAFISGITVGTCEMLNNILYNDTTPGDGTAVPASSAVIGTGAIDLGLTGVGVGRFEGCVKNAGVYSFYKVLHNN